MSQETKKCFRLFTIADYDLEENWLREMAKQGWMFRHVTICVYTFERCEPQDVVFKLEFREKPLDLDQDYMHMLKDFGWEYVTSFNHFRYFRKPAEVDERSNELFTENESKLKMLRTIQLRRLLPITVIFLCIIIPNFIRMIERGDVSIPLRIFWIMIIVLYIFLFIKVLTGFARLKAKYKEREK